MRAIIQENNIAAVAFSTQIAARRWDFANDEEDKSNASYICRVCFPSNRMIRAVEAIDQEIVHGLREVLGFPIRMCPTRAAGQLRLPSRSARVW